VVYVEGPIMPGSGSPSLFGGSDGAYSDPIRKALDKAAQDEKVKAVVLRVDSPGGSAVASEEILRGVELVRDAGIPVVVSMGSTAASGGYYIACTADAILADASTITASIGVVGGKIATDEMWGELGISWHTWQRGQNAGLLGFLHPFTPDERESLHRYMTETYDAFKAHVSEGRGTKLTKPLEDMAGGRVYTGAQALAVTMRGLALREIHFGQWFRVMRKEVNAGFWNGVGIAAVCAIGVYFWSGSIGLVLVIAITMVISMVMAGIAGALVPITLVRLGQDPAVASSIILTTVTDVAGFMSVLGIATLLSGMLS